MSSKRKPEKQRRRLIDVRPAIGEAGHEVEELGYEGIPDTGPLVHGDDDDERDRSTADASEIPLTEFPTD